MSLEQFRLRSMSNIETARSQTRLIAAAINGDSGAVQILGSMGHDAHPERLLAVGLAHAENALGSVIEELELLRSEVDSLRRRLRH